MSFIARSQNPSVRSVYPPEGLARARPIEGLRAFKLHILLIGIAALAPAALSQQSPQTPQTLEGRFIELSEGIRIDVMSNQRLAYLIEADEGVLEEESRIIWLEGVQVSIYGVDEEIREEISGQSARVWPVKVWILESDGSAKLTEQFDWSLSGGVRFRSAEGYFLRTPELRFNHRENSISSIQGVEYQLPTGENGHLVGRAEKFKAVIDHESGTMNRWEINGPGEIRFESGDQNDE